MDLEYLRNRSTPLDKKYLKKSALCTFLKVVLKTIFCKSSFWVYKEMVGLFSPLFLF